MASDDIIITVEEAEAKNENLTDNLHSKNKVVEIENGFNLYRALYRYYTRTNFDWWSFVYASKSDNSAIAAALENRPERFQLVYVNRLILREDGEPSSIIIWGN